MYYVIPDLHGRYDLLKQALDRIYSDHPEGGKIVFLGDYIDRGPQNVDVLLTVMNPPDNWEFITLKGNHEQMFHSAFDLQSDYYDYEAAKEIKNDPRLELRDAAKWMEKLPIVHIVGDNIFAHAFYDPFRSPEDQHEQSVVWNRYNDSEPFGIGDGKFLTHGHTPRMNGPIMSPNRCNLDCGAVFYDRLVVAIFDEDTAGPVSFVVFDG
jgi:serine/threonine protein phosphatase 1